MRTGPRQHNVEGRPTCYKCFRPLTHCLCNEVQPFQAHFNILILQHPNERHKYYSTSKLVTSALSNARLLRGLEFSREQVLDRKFDHKTFLLYPSPNAVDCETVPLDQDSTVIVVDGTWSEAGKVVRRNQFLSEITHITFKQNFRSNYLIRKQPRGHCLSTIESIGYLLKLNARHERLAAPATLESYDRLFTLFEKMVSTQLAYFPRCREASTKNY